MIMSAGVGHLEKQALFSWMQRRATASIAAALELSDLPIQEQRRVVKRFKDRIAKRVLRAKAGSRATAERVQPKD
jgi:hypothetical protein